MVGCSDNKHIPTIAPFENETDYCMAGFPKVGFAVHEGIAGGS